MIIRQRLADATTQLQAANIDSAALDARLLMQHILNCDHAALILKESDELNAEAHTQFDALLARRAKREPLSHIIEKRGFWKDEFFVCSDVLDPRPDSETLIETLLALHKDTQKPYDILDLGTGSGCLILSALREFSNASGTAVDLSPAALDIAKRNAKSLNLSDRLTFVLDNWGKTLQTHYDMIMSNPPYVVEDDISTLAPEVRLFEPFGALSGGTDGLQAYMALMPQIKRLLKPDGIAVIELGAGQEHAVSEIACKSGLNVVDVIPDLAGVQRVLVVKQ